MLSSVTQMWWRYMRGTRWGEIKSNISRQAEKQGSYQFISRKSLTEREMSQQCVALKTGRRPWDAARKIQDSGQVWHGQLVYLCVSGLSQASLSAGHMTTSPCLPASVCYYSEEPGVSALKGLWEVTYAICSIYNLPCCTRMGTRCPVNIKADVYEQRKNNRLTHEWRFSLIHIIFMQCWCAACWD